MDAQDPMLSPFHSAPPIYLLCLRVLALIRIEVAQVDPQLSPSINLVKFLKRPWRHWGMEVGLLIFMI